MSRLHIPGSYGPGSLQNCQPIFWVGKNSQTSLCHHIKLNKGCVACYSLKSISNRLQQHILIGVALVLCKGVKLGNISPEPLACGDVYGVDVGGNVDPSKPCNSESHYRLHPAPHTGRSSQAADMENHVGHIQPAQQNTD